MRSKIIPAQVTTVEDKIAGNLSFTQLLLLLAPLILGMFIYAAFPPTVKLSSYKVILILLLALVFTTLSLRVRGRLVANWISVISAYLLRPKIYLFNKNNSYLRSIEVKEKSVEAVKQKRVVLDKKSDLNSNLVSSQVLDANLIFNFQKKGFLKG